MTDINIKRWSKTSLRTLHLVGVAGVGGGVLFGLDGSVWNGYWWLTLASGTLMMLIDLASNPLWLIQIRGLVIVGKLVLVALIGSFPRWDPALLIAVVVLSGIISHAPSSIRYYSIFHRRVVTSTSDTKG